MQWWQHRCRQCRPVCVAVAGGGTPGVVVRDVQVVAGSGAAVGTAAWQSSSRSSHPPRQERTWRVAGRQRHGGGGAGAQARQAGGPWHRAVAGGELRQQAAAVAGGTPAEQAAWRQWQRRDQAETVQPGRQEGSDPGRHPAVVQAAVNPVCSTAGRRQYMRQVAGIAAGSSRIQADPGRQAAGRQEGRIRAGRHAAAE